MKREELRLFLFLYLSFHLYFTDEPFLCRHGGLPEKIMIWFFKTTIWNLSARGIGAPPAHPFLPPPMPWPPSFHAERLTQPSSFAPIVAALKAIATIYGHTPLFPNWPPRSVPKQRAGPRKARLQAASGLPPGAFHPMSRNSAGIPVRFV